MLHFDLHCREAVRFQSILRKIVQGCNDTCYTCNVVGAYHMTLWHQDMLLWQQWSSDNLRVAIFSNPSNCCEKFSMLTCSCTTGSNKKLTNVSLPLEQESRKPKAQEEPQRIIRGNWCKRIEINRMKDIKVRKGWSDREVFYKWATSKSWGKLLTTQCK